MASQTIVLKLARPVRRRLQRLSRKAQDKTTFRRCQILLRWAAGETPPRIAQQLGCAVSTVYRTRQGLHQHGEAWLVPQKSPGRPPKVSRAQARALDRTVACAPRQVGENFSNWTARRLAEHLKLAVHAVTVLRQLWALGWRWRRPVLRIASPDPRYAAKARYLRRLKQAARRGQIHLYYADEMDVALLPTVSGCWMRQGHQTQVDTPGQNQKQHVLGAVHAVTGALVWLTWPQKNNVGFRRLLQALLAVHADDPLPVVVIVDNYRIHKAQAVQALLAGVRRSLRLYFLPTYAPRLNPIERVWHHVRRNVTDNTYFKTLKRLLHAVAAFLAELVAEPAVVRSIIAA